MSDLSVQGTSAASLTEATSKTSSTGKTSAMDMNSFLTMFTTQLQYQDPTNPLESYELAAQLAQFSSVERLTSIDDKLSSLQSYMAAQNNSQMIQAIGKEVVGTGNTIQVTDAGPTKASFQLGSDAAKTTVSILNSAGETIKTIEMGAISSGDHAIQWDGTNSAGKKVASGSYTFQVAAVGGDGKSVTTTSSITGTAYAFRMVDGNPYLVLNNANGILLPTSAVKEIHNPSA